MRAVRILVFTALAVISLIPASPALAAVPSCFNSEPTTVGTAFNEVAQYDDDMAAEGSAMIAKLASNGIGFSGIVSGEYIRIADKYGYKWDCTTESFALKTPPTTASSTTTTMPTTTTRPTATSSSTTTTTWPALDWPDIKIVVPTPQASPSTATTQVKTSVTTRPTMTYEAAAGTAATESPSPSTATSTVASAATPWTADVMAAPASHQSDGSGGNGTMLLLLAFGLVAALGIGGGVLIGLRRR